MSLRITTLKVVAFLFVAVGLSHHAAAQAAQIGATSAAATVPAMSPGEYVARTANCIACHAVPGGKAYAGGLKMMTPLGAIHSTNITPDTETGIGGYSLEEFDRAVRLGVAKDGHRLYPAMPYPSYAKMSDADIKALYDYFMKEVAAVKQPNLPSEIPWPLNMRWPLAVWNAVFFDDARYANDTAKDAAWNRGAYLVQGPGHCGACHTPRGIAFNEKAMDEKGDAFLVGAPLDNWSSPNLTQAINTGLGRWSVADIAVFMKKGHNAHGTAFGTMTEVINYSTQFLTDADLNAMAVYLKALPSKHDKGPPYAYDPATATALRSSKFDKPGAATYMQRCASCHGIDGKGYAPYLSPLAGNSAVMDPDPLSLINITLNGSARVVVAGMPNAYRMPKFRTLTDQQVADVLTFVRGAWGNSADAVKTADVTRLRHDTTPATDRIEVLSMK